MQTVTKKITTITLIGGKSISIGAKPLVSLASDTIPAPALGEFVKYIHPDNGSESYLGYDRNHELLISIPAHAVLYVTYDGWYW